MILSFLAHLPSGAEKFFETNCQAVVCAGSIQRVHPKPTLYFLKRLDGYVARLFLSFLARDMSETTLTDVHLCCARSRLILRSLKCTIMLLAVICVFLLYKQCLHNMCAIFTLQGKSKTWYLNTQITLFHVA